MDFRSILLVVLGLSLAYGIEISTTDQDVNFEITAKEGGNITLQCTIKSPGYNFLFNPLTWRKIQGDEEQQINTGIAINSPFLGTSRYSMDYKNADNSHAFPITIQDLTASENGRYRCEVQNSQGVVLDHIEYSVQILTPITSVAITDAMPKIEKEGKQVLNLEAGKPVNVSCIAKGGNPQPYLKVKMDKEDKTNSFKVSAVPQRKGVEGLRTTLYTVSRSYLFTPTEENNGQVVTCDAQVTGLPAMQQQATLNVKYAPSFTCKKTQFTRVGQGHSIVCGVKGNPIPDIDTLSWMVSGANGTKAEVSVDDGYSTSNTVDGNMVNAVLKIENVSEAHFQTYYLTASNQIGALTHEVVLSEPVPTTPEPEVKPGYTIAPGGDNNPGSAAGAVRSLVAIPFIFSILSLIL